MGPREWICPQELSHNRMQYSHLSVYRGVTRIFQGGGVTRCNRGFSPDCHVDLHSVFYLKKTFKWGGGGGSGWRIPQAPPSPIYALGSWIQMENGFQSLIVAQNGLSKHCTKWTMLKFHMINMTRHDMTWHCDIAWWEIMQCNITRNHKTLHRNISLKISTLVPKLMK